MLKDYITITKPGIIIGNLVSFAAGVFLAGKSEPLDTLEVMCATVGVALIIASGCVLNNIYDKDIDSKMRRTKKRAEAMSRINVDHAFIYALLLLSFGTVLLFETINPLTTIVVLMGYIFYVFFYTMWYKRSSIYGTLVGSLSGAVPPLAGYLTVTNYISTESLLLFVLFCLWQIPHSYAIALFRIRDYHQADIPVLPIVKGIQRARRHMQAYVLIFSLTALGLFLYGHTGFEYLAITAVVCGLWTRVTFRSINAHNYVPWAKNVFKTSLIVVMSISGALGLELLLI